MARRDSKIGVDEFGHILHPEFPVKVANSQNLAIASDPENPLAARGEQWDTLGDGLDVVALDRPAVEIVGDPHGIGVHRPDRTGIRIGQPRGLQNAWVPHPVVASLDPKRLDMLATLIGSAKGPAVRRRRQVETAFTRDKISAGPIAPGMGNRTGKMAVAVPSNTA